VIATDGRDEKIACSCGGDIGDADSLVLLPLLLLNGRLEQLDRRRIAERLNPNPANAIDMPGWGVARSIAGGIGEDNHGKLEALRLVHGHQAHALGSFLDNGRFIGLAAVGIDF
jgi:hypothetical protein